MKLTGLFIGAIGLVNVSHAALNDVGGGLVNDTTQNITWMKDANFVKTACDASPGPPKNVWDAFITDLGSPGTGLSSSIANFTSSDRNANDICLTDNGRLNWYEAELWIAILNDQTYLGFNNWRQPATLQPDATCESQISGQDYGYNCRGVENELAHLFNISLNNPNDNGTGATGGDAGTNCYPDGTTFGNEQSPDHCFDNAGPFTNPMSYSYWSGTDYGPDPNDAWYFRTTYGNQDA